MYKPQKIVNIHAHISKTDDVGAKVNKWLEDGAYKVCVLAIEWKGLCGNDEVLAHMKAYPDVIVGMGYINLWHDMDKAGKVTELYEKGFKGLKMISPAHPYSDERYFPFYEKAEELGMPIVFHTGLVSTAHSRDRSPNSEYMRPYTMDVIGRMFPDLKIVCAHLGTPHYEEAINIAITYPNIYFDITGHSGNAMHIARLKKALGPYPGADFDNPDENPAHLYFTKFMFGTDSPQINHWYAASENIMDYLHITEKTREDFYWRNACKLFGWN